MKINKWLIFFIIFFSVGLLSNCSSKQKIIKQSQDTRRVAEAYMSKGDYSEALKYLLQAEAFYADDYLLQDDLGKVYVAKGKYDIAIEHFKKALAIEPEFAPGKNNLGSTYLLAEQWDDAIAVFKELNDNLIYATPHYPMYNLGWAYYNKGDYTKAMDYFNKALKLQHGFILALRGLGLTYLKTGDVDTAIEYFKKATEKSPRFPQLYIDLGNAYITKKHYDLAIEAFEEVTQIQPDSDIADRALSQIKKLKKLIRDHRSENETRIVH